MGYDLDMGDWIPEEMVTNDLIFSPIEHTYRFPEKGAPSLFGEYKKFLKQEKKREKQKKKIVIQEPPKHYSI
jgi:hypothetical protein